MPPGKKAVYYSPYGGTVLAVLDAADDEYEQSLRSSGVAFKREQVNTADLAGKEPQKCRLRRDAKGILQVEVDN